MNNVELVLVLQVCNSLPSSTALFIYVYIQLYIIKKTPDGPRRHPLTVSDPHQRHIDTLIGGIGRRQDQFERGARTETRDRLQFQGAIAMHFPCISGG
jgi:hypothetical protein